MIFWILAITVTAIACAALFFASAGRASYATASDSDATTAHYKSQLKEIEADITSGRLGVAEAQAAKGELAREMLRQQKSGGDARPGLARLDRLLIPASLAGVAIIAFGVYVTLGNPQMPAEPLAGRTAPAPAEAQIDLDDAVAQIEAQLAKTPDDLRGWSVIAPVYMQLGRYDDAVKALRRVDELAPPSADTRTDLAEALTMQNGGDIPAEALTLLASAAALDKAHIRSRFYIAGELTRTGDYAAAVPAWQELLSLSVGSESWVATAQAGLAAAEAGLAGEPLPDASATSAPVVDADQAEAISAMVEGLSARLAADGGSLEEWTRLVRSRLVLGDAEAAQQAYDAARAAYPDAATRTELDALAAEAGLR